MPDPVAPQGTAVNMTAAPGGDLSFDDLFPVDPQNLPQAAGTEPSAAPQAPAAPAPEQFYLKSQDGKIVYKTAEDAISGIAHKDQLVDRYRSFLNQQGIDPNTLQPVKKTDPAPQAPSEPQSYNYVENQERFFDDLSSAVQKGDKRAYASTMQKFLNEQFAPIAPLISEVARQRAVRQVSEEVQDFSSFLTSDDYRQTVESLPTLKQAIEASENNFSASQHLGELYKIVYLASQGRRKPEPVVSATPVVAAPVQSTPARPTTAPSIMTPPQPSAPPDLRTSEGRKTLIRDMESRGVLDRSF